MDIVKEQEFIEKYIKLTSDLLQNELVQSMKKYRHHREVSTHFHSVYVSYSVMKMCQRLRVKNERDIVRAALLHDFYLYEWYTEKHEEYHIYYHPKESVKNIEKHFAPLTPMQKNMVLSHMFPTSKVMPKYLGSWILTLCDKHCATADYFKISRRFIPVYNEINRRICDD
ncbi:MAG: HD domain-containing protein [Eubacterium sp.]|nr:HD domain-containing protein [Eubacterium sp.]